MNLINKVIAVALILVTQAPPTPSFEAASVKPNKSGQRGFALPPPAGDRWTATNVTLKMLIGYAYNVQDFQLSGVAGWMDSEPFDIVAKAPGRVSEDQVRIMLRGLLADEFKLKLRQTTKEMPLYTLVVARPGLKMPRTTEDCNAPGTPTKPCGGFRVRNRSQLTGQKVELSQLVELLSTLTGRYITDKTGLTGNFDITLQWTPDAALALGPEPGAADDSMGATLFTALCEQLGLELKSEKGPVPILTIEHAENPG